MIHALITTIFCCVVWLLNLPSLLCLLPAAFYIGREFAQDIPAETGQHVEFFDCLLEDGGRRFPEVQDGMECLLHDCLIRNWGAPDRFTVRNFGAWAHAGGKIDAVGCVFWQDEFWRPWKQFWADLIDHIGQAWNDEGIRGLLRPTTYLPGVCRGLLATDGVSIGQSGGVLSVLDVPVAGNTTDLASGRGQIGRTAIPVELADLDTLIADGWYAISGETLNLPEGVTEGVCRASSGFTSGTVVQTMFTYDGTPPRLCALYDGCRAELDIVG